VGEERVGDPRQPLEASASSVASGSSDRLPLVSTIGPAQTLEQQVVEWRVRQEEPDAAVQRGSGPGSA
jgi:hypothetical protein